MIGTLACRMCHTWGQPGRSNWNTSPIVSMWKPVCVHLWAASSCETPVSYDQYPHPAVITHLTILSLSAPPYMHSEPVTENAALQLYRYSVFPAWLYTMRWTDLLEIGAPNARLVMLLHGAQVISSEQDVGRRVRDRFELGCYWCQLNCCRLVHRLRCETDRSLL